MRKHFANDTFHTLLRSRHMENIYKHCILLELGNIPYYVASCEDFSESSVIIKLEKDFENQDLESVFSTIAKYDENKIKNIRIREIAVMPETVKFVLKMYDRIFLPSQVAIGDMLLEKSDEKTPTNAVIEILSKSNSITKQDALKNCKNIIDACESIIACKDTKSKEIDKIKGYIINDTNYKKEILFALYGMDLKRLLEKTIEQYKLIEHMSDDVKITCINHRDLTRKTKNKNVQETLKTLISVDLVIPYPKAKTTIEYIYFEYKRGISLPEGNYVNYTCDGLIDQESF